MKTALKLFLVILVVSGVYWFVFHRTPEQKAFETALTAARAGDTQAAYTVGTFYAQGSGVEPNGVQAAEWFRKAAADGNMQAAWKLAELYLEGKQIPQDLEEGFAYAEVAARNGNARAQRELARFYQEGLANIPQSQGEALYWYLQAANGGDKVASKQAEKIKTQAEPLYQDVENFMIALKLAQEGDGNARLQVGKSYQQGYPVAHNDEEALRYLTLAWEENQLSQGAYEAAQLLKNGEDSAKAMALLGAAAEAKNTDAQYALGELAYRMDPPNYTDAFAWFSNAAAAGHAQAQYMTGFMLMQGQGTNRSVPLAIKFFRDAAEQNHVAAQYVLGQIYWKGLGVPADKKAGEEWLKKAAANGNTSAQALLAN